MKIAVFEPEPRVSGPTNWAFNLRTGLQQLGHEAQVVSFTKSGVTRKSWGKPQNGGRWWSAAPDLVVKTADLVETLDSFDVIILPEIKVPLHDKEAKKNEVSPAYVRALVETKTPWTTALHGSMYPDRDTPFVPELLSSPSRGEYLITMSDDSVGSSRHFKDVQWVKAPMPFTPKFDIDAPVPTTKVVGTSGRFIFNKGQPIVAMAGAYLPPEYTVEIWGSCAVGQGPSPTYWTYEALRDRYHAQTKRYATTVSDDPDKADGNTITPFPWDARPQGGSLVRYLGNYTDSAAVAARFEVHVNLTTWTFARGLVEYSSLEAMDAGALAITPRHLYDNKFRMLVIDDLPPTFPSLGRINSDLGDELAQKVATALKECLAIDPDTRFQIAQHNRVVLRRRNDPRISAQALIDSALSARSRSVFGSAPPPPAPPAEVQDDKPSHDGPRGSSGAEFVFGSVVTKTGNERVAQQGEWLASLPEAAGLPRVLEVNEVCYSMERLSDVPWSLVVPSKVVDAAVEVLERDVWSQDARVELDRDGHLEKVENLAIRFLDPSFRVALLDRGLEYAGVGKVCLTHGDPTLDNVMLRDQQVVLIDPVPAYGAVPDLRSVDLGKLLQSAYGFERMRYGLDFRVATRHVYDAYERLGVDENEAKAAEYWCAVHLLRACPYMTPSVSGKLVKTIVKLVKTW